MVCGLTTSVFTQQTLLNPGELEPALTWVRTPVEDCTPVEGYKDRYAIDPHTLHVWKRNGNLPKTCGYRPALPPIPVRGALDLCLTVTRACNLDCRYCYVHNRPDIQGGSMSQNTAFAALDYLRESPQMGISFFGGEPLLCWDLVQDVVGEIERRFGSAKFRITTNGTLVTPDKAEFLHQHGFGLIVSLDGPPDVHEFNRPAKAGAWGDESGFQATLCGLEVLRDSGCSEHVTLRATYTKDCTRLLDRLTYLNELCDDGLACGFSVEPVSSSESSCGDISSERFAFTVADVARLSDEFRNAFDWCAEEALGGRPIRWRHVRSFATRLIRHCHSFTECGAGNGLLCITPNGDVHACQREAGNRIGGITCGIEQSERAVWWENRYIAKEACSKCWARGICGGGCRANSVIHCGDIGIPYQADCAYRKIVIAETIHLLDRVGPEFWAKAFGVGKALDSQVA